MSIDLISAATQKSKIRLLNVSVIFFLFQIFGITFKDNALPFGLLVNAEFNQYMKLVFILTMSYLLLTFIIYSYRDWRASSNYKIGVFSELRDNLAIGIEELKNSDNTFLKTYNLKMFTGGLLNKSMSVMHNQKINEKGKEGLESIQEWKDFADKVYEEIFGSKPQGSDAASMGAYCYANRDKIQILANEMAYVRKDRVYLKTLYFWEFFLPVVVYLISVFSPLYSEWIRNLLFC